MPLSNIREKSEIMRKKLKSIRNPAGAGRRTRRPKADKPAIGWREWVGLPALGVDRIKAKVDTGARTAALHAWNIQRFARDGETWVRFELHPVQRDNRTRLLCEARLAGQKDVRNSGGHREKRVVIITEVSLGSQTWPIEVTLTNRDQMGFRMLLGRASVRGRFTVDPSTSFRGRKLAGAARNGAGFKSVPAETSDFNERKTGS